MTKVDDTLKDSGSVETDLVQAHFLRSSGVKTPIFIRYSTVTLGREFPDLARNPRGFAVKFYTGEGNYDIVGLNFVCQPPLHAYNVGFFPSLRPISPRCRWSPPLLRLIPLAHWHGARLDTQFETTWPVGAVEMR